MGNNAFSVFDYFHSLTKINHAFTTNKIKLSCVWAEGEQRGCQMTAVEEAGAGGRVGIFEERALEGILEELAQEGTFEELALEGAFWFLVFYSRKGEREVVCGQVW